MLNILDNSMFRIQALLSIVVAVVWSTENMKNFKKNKNNRTESGFVQDEQLYSFKF